MDDKLYDDEWMISRMQMQAEMAMPYCPYSDYPVRAAVAVRWPAFLTDDPYTIRFYHGANYEVVSFNQTMHAEHSAITAALNDRRRSGNAQIIQAVYVETVDGGSPCGHCRQIINEFAALPNIPIFIRNTQMDTVRKTSLGILLPDAFDMSSLA